MQNLEIYKLKNEIKALQLQLENQRRQYEEEINYLKSQLATFQRKLFGQKSECTSIVLPDGDNPQLSLFDEAEYEAPPPAEEPAPATEVKSHKRKKNTIPGKTSWIIPRFHMKRYMLMSLLRAYPALHAVAATWNTLEKSWSVRKSM